MERVMEFQGSFIWPAVGALGLFSWLAVESWSENRRKEREAFYRNDTLRKIAESQGGASAALEYLREEERNAERRRRERLKLGGLISMAVGIGVSAFLVAVLPYNPVFILGLIPLLVGLSLLIYVYIVAPSA
jgi:Flp pilus assembly protein TadB